MTLSGIILPWLERQNYPVLILTKKESLDFINPGLDLLYKKDVKIFDPSDFEYFNKVVIGLYNICRYDYDIDIPLLDKCTRFVLKVIRYWKNFNQ